MSRVSYLGGEAGRRGFFGGTWPKARIVGLLVVVPAGAFLILTMQLLGMVTTIAAVLVIWVVTMPTPAGSPLHRWQNRRRWKERIKTGTVDFAPFDQDRWDALCEQAQSASKADRAKVYRQLAAMRETPDGVEGMRWLQDERGKPGIAWHTPTGEPAYLSVVWSTSGQIKGMASGRYLDSCMEAFGKLQAGWGSRLRLPAHIQTITRVLPTDTARHEDWVVRELNKKSKIELRRSYDQLMRLLGRGGMVQRHLVVVRWPIELKFIADAAKHGEGVDGWRILMRDQIESCTRAIVGARFQDVTVLSARQVAAVLRHLQHPSFPFDQAGDLSSPTDCWIPSHDEWSYTTTTAVPPDKTDPVDWLHRTAMFPITGVATYARNGLWLAPLLTSLGTPIVRTISLQTAMIPASEARLQARMDATTDMADIQKQKEKGELSADDLGEQLSGAQRRLRDLRGGTHHQGAEWVGHVTITAQTRDELSRATAIITEAADKAGVSSLEWLDTFQSAANSYTWPVARGMEEPKKSRSAQMRGLVTGKGPKEAL